MGRPRLTNNVFAFMSTNLMSNLNCLPYHKIHLVFSRDNMGFWGCHYWVIFEYIHYFYEERGRSNRKKWHAIFNGAKTTSILIMLIYSRDGKWRNPNKKERKQAMLKIMHPKAPWASSTQIYYHVREFETQTSNASYKDREIDFLQKI